MLTDKLPPKQKIVFVLRDLQGLSVREVSSILRLSENSVKANLVYARRFLREHLIPIISD
jgi:RNA polymerase sigma-70 factor (ECF subfamily)